MTGVRFAATTIERSTERARRQLAGTLAEASAGAWAMKRIGFTSGSFDPVTNGHRDVIERAARMVDTLVVGVGVHPGKAPLFTVAEKIELLKAETAPIAKATGCKIEIVTFDNLTVAAAAARPAPASSFAVCAMPATSTMKCRWPG